MSTSTEANKTLVRRHYAVFNGGDPAAWKELLADDFVTHRAQGDGRGRDTYVNGYAAYVAAFSELAVDVQRLVAEDNVVVAQFTSRGRHVGEFMGFPPTDREWSFTGIAIYRIEEGRLAEAWYEEDILGWFRQLGADSTPTITPVADA